SGCTVTRTALIPRGTRAPGPCRPGGARCFSRTGVPARTGTATTRPTAAPLSARERSAGSWTRCTSRSAALTVAPAARCLVDGRHQVEEQVPDPVDIALEELEHLGLGHRLGSGLTLHAGVVVGDEGDGGVAQAQLPGQIGLGILGHVDDLPPLGPVPLRLRPG